MKQKSWYWANCPKYQNSNYSLSNQTRTGWKDNWSLWNNEFDILLAPSIVESGLHLPNANSIIIDGADRFGIADLHQLRGRVGRSNKEGFCYYIVEDKNKSHQMQ